MAEEVKTTTLEEDYLAQIAELKNKLDNETVALDEYNKVRADNKRLMENYINGVKQKVDKDDEVSEIDLAKKIINGSSNNIDYWKDILAWRDKVIQRTGNDPWLPQGRKYNPTSYDIEASNDLAEIATECLEQANGNVDVFTPIFNKRVGL